MEFVKKVTKTLAAFYRWLSLSWTIQKRASRYFRRFQVFTFTPIMG